MAAATALGKFGSAAPLPLPDGVVLSAVEETAGEEATEAADGAVDGATAASHTLDEPGAHDSARSTSAYLLAPNGVHQPTDAPPVSRPVDWH